MTAASEVWKTPAKYPLVVSSWKRWHLVRKCPLQQHTSRASLSDQALFLAKRASGPVVALSEAATQHATVERSRSFSISRLFHLRSNVFRLFDHRGFGLDVAPKELAYLTSFINNSSSRSACLYSRAHRSLYGSIMRWPQQYIWIAHAYTHARPHALTHAHKSWNTSRTACQNM